MNYPGGKNGAGVTQFLCNQVPPHRTLIECFAGSAALTRALRPAERTILVEADPRAGADLLLMDLGRPRVQVVRGDALQFLRCHAWEPETFLYLDPPYLMETRTAKRRYYACEFDTVAQHRELLDLIRTLPCMVMISHYSAPLYQLALADWRSAFVRTTNRAGKQTEEWVWCSYPEPQELHDYRYLGANYREREYLSRMKKRWKAKLAAMPVTKRYALLSALEEMKRGEE